MKTSFVCSFVVAAVSLSFFSTQGQAQNQSVATFFDAADGLPLADKEACAEQICGPLPKATPEPTLQDKAMTKIFDRELKSGLDIAVKLKAERFQRFSETLQARSTEIGSVKLTQKELPLVNLFWASTLTAKVASYFTATETGYDLKPGFEAAVPELSKEQAAQLRAILSKFLSSTEYRLQSYLSVIDLTTLLRMMNPSGSPSIIALDRVAFAKNLLSRYESFSQNYAELAVPIPRGIKKLADGKDITKAQLHEIADTIPFLFVNDLTPETDPAFFADQPVATTTGSDFLKSSSGQTLMNSLATASTSGATLVEQCRHRLNTTLQAHVTDRDLSRAKVMTESIRTEALAQAKQIFAQDAALSEKVEKALKAIEFSMPLTAGSQILQIRNALAAEILETRQTLRAIKASNPSYFYIMVKMPQPYDDLFKSIKNLCDENNLSQFSDHALSGLGMVTLGAESVKTPEVGRPVVSHEVGHVVFEALKGSGDRFEKLKACIAAKHGTQTNRPNSDNEDFADWFSAKVSKAFESRDVGVRNVGCSLLAGSSERYGPDGLALTWPATYPDTHSPGLYRALVTEIQMGKTVPPVCQMIAKYALPSATFEACEY